MQEVWKEIPGYEGYYEVSNLGNVKGLERKLKFGNRERIKPEVILKQNVNNSGYLILSLYKEGKYKSYKAHRLVALAFISNPENKSCVNHKDSNKLNNSIDNLEWCTHSENSIHAYKAGKLKSPSKKLNQDIINNIRELYNSGNFYQKDLAKMFNISNMQISRIIRKLNWNSI